MTKQKKDYELWKGESLRSVVVAFQKELQARAITVSRDPISRFGKVDIDSITNLQGILQELKSAKPGAVVPIPKLKPSSLTYLTSKLKEIKGMPVAKEIAQEEMLRQAGEKTASEARAEELPINLQETSNFSFQHSFAILAHPNGGFVIQQLFTGKPQYSRAFSNLEDLTSYLVTQKEAFLMLEDQS